jgi:hypothetical protein
MKKAVHQPNKKYSGFTTLLVVFLPLFMEAQLPAFPGAEGTGKFTTGGRGTTTTPTTVYAVTRLEDDNLPGSLRYALNTNVPSRTIIFRISGTIHLTARLTIKGNTTIAGQTAPGDGICIADHPTAINGDNVIVRYVRFRMGDKNQNLGMVDGSGGDDTFGDLGHKNVIIDHCTFSWSSDETLTVYRGDSVTLQWNIISEPLNYSYHFEAGGTDYQEHGYGGIWGARNGSFHHNLFAHAKGRNPRFAGSSTYTPGTAGQESADFRNNVIYNWGSYSTNGGEGGNYNIVGNYYKYGPSTSSGNSAGVAIRFMIMNPSKSTALPYPKIYLAGNFVDNYPTITQNNWRGMAMAGGSLADTVLSKVTTPFQLLPVAEQGATEAYELVLDHAGVKLPARDTLDQRIVNNVRNRTGKIIDVQGGYPHGTPYAQTVTAWPVLQSVPPPTDDDGDGMPNSWETANGLNAANAADRSLTAPNSYTHLENYLNSLAADAMILNGSLQAFSQGLGTPSATQTYKLEGKHLTGPVTIIPPPGYEVSNNGSDWFTSANPLVINPSSGNIQQGPLYVRLNASVAGSYNGVLRHMSRTGAVVEFGIAGTASSVTGLTPAQEQQKIFLYPNPAMSNIVLHYPRVRSDVRINLYNAAGTRVAAFTAKRGADKTPIATGSLPEGKYFVEFCDKSGKRVLSFLKHL